MPTDAKGYIQGLHLVLCLTSNVMPPQPTDAKGYIQGLHLALCLMPNALCLTSNVMPPQPTDAKGYIFAARTVNVRLRAGTNY